MRSALLLGRHHQQIGTVDLVAEGPCAIAISRGGAPKRYSYTEPNEDACCFVWGPHGVMLAVADGHHGAGGSERAIQHLVESASGWLDEPTTDRASLGGALVEQLRKAVGEIGVAIFDEAAAVGLPPPATTLSVAVVRPGDDLLAHASIGDSHVFVTSDAQPCDLGWSAGRDDNPEYLGRERDLADEAKLTVDFASLSSTRAVALITDGFSEHGIGHPDPAAELHTLQIDSLNGAPDLRAPDTCRAITESALDVQRRNRSGDNVACAVWAAE
ncbi:MAG: protein phosphatase 2C domain-containing protein [Myxococcota bacterium]|jgi:hypothetical protein|nr:protein phosphatase 2C domain-containing protein [Myxococcota bacterium]